jgi:hypothetical protein
MIDILQVAGAEVTGRKALECTMRRYANETRLMPQKHLAFHMR